MASALRATVSQELEHSVVGAQVMDWQLCPPPPPPPRQHLVQDEAREFTRKP